MTNTVRTRFLRILRISLFVLASLFVIAFLAGLGLWLQVRASLPTLEGEIEMTGLEAPVVIERDSIGVPTIRGESRSDVARALGFLHGQERFFQMDLLRRQPAGELAELFGSMALESDRELRIHRFRDRARNIVELERQDRKKLLVAYAEGVNQGLRALDARPFEYVLLRTTPRPWAPEDSLLVLYAMYLDLQDEDGSRDSSYGVLHDALPIEMFDFLAPLGTRWDAPIDGTEPDLPPIPPADVFSVREKTDRTPGEIEGESDAVPGSNNFAVSGRWTSDGRAILAGDMHLGINVPTIWYRASMVYPAGDEVRRVTGVTLPGTPVLVAGSNGNVAWAYTNSYGDWVDLVVVEDLGDGTYMTPTGPKEYEIHREELRDGEGDVETIEIRETIWGPIVDEDHRGRPRALRWVAHDRQGVNQNLFDLESASTVVEAIEVASTIGAPAQNFVVADRSGSIGWTIMGPIPHRIGEYDGRLPQRWDEGPVGWDGWLEAGEYPRIIDPEEGRIWTANARVVGGGMLEKIGDGGYAFGARARQIREDLRRHERVAEHDLLEIQLDDRAVFLDRWQTVLLDLLDEDAIEDDPKRAELRRLVENWGARASVDSAGYRMVRAFHVFLEDDVLGPLTAAATETDDRFRLNDIAQTEHALWTIVSERPEHLLSPEYESWDAQLLATADRVIEYFTEEGRSLESRTWGERNTSRFRHPLAGAIPLFGKYLEYPERQLPGDWNMPRAQGPTFGASQRMVVSPGKEAEGFFHMPGGQSGHPLSQHFSDSHEAWVSGDATPFLPGETVHQLELVPVSR